LGGDVQTAAGYPQKRSRAMSGFNYSIAFDISQQSSLVRATSLVNKLDRSVDRVDESSDRARRSMMQMGRDGGNAFDRIRSRAAGFVATLGLMTFTLGSLQTTAEIEGLNRSIEFSSGVDGQKNLEFLDQTIESLALNSRSARVGFQQWLGSVQGTALEGQRARDIFYSVSEATTAMNVSAENSEGVFLALSQMASKGKVSAEELRGQLGERLPGAFNIAARAMGVTTGELDKMLSTGQLMAEDFLPAFARELHNTFGKQAAESTNSASANFNKFQNGLEELKLTIGTELMPVATGLINNFFIPAVHWIKENIGLLKGMGIAYGVMTGLAKTAAVAQALVAIATGNATISFWGLNAALLANPLVWVSTLLIGLAAAAVWAYNKFDWFRGGLTGIWSTIKETGKILLEWLITPLTSLGKIIAGVFTLDKDLIQSGIKDATSFLQDTVLDAGTRIGSAWQTGYAKGVDNFNKSKALGESTPGKPDALSSEFANSPTGTAAPMAPAGGGAGESVRNGVAGITGGGKQTKNITINIAKFFDNVNMHATDVSGGAEEVADQVMRKLLQSLNSANQMQ
jgi:tape measure domain-containing protein